MFFNTLLCWLIIPVLLVDYLLAGLMLGFFASLSVVALVVLACLIYKRYALRKPSPRVQWALFGTRYYRMEVA